MDAHENATPAYPLPAFFWQHVLSFLTLETIQNSKLYAVNHAFLDYYLKQKYQTSKLQFYDGVIFPREAQMLSLPIIARVVKTLKLGITENMVVTNIFADVIRIASRRFPNNSKRRPAAIFEQLPECLKLMTSLEAIEYTITSRNTASVLQFNKIFPLALATAWKASRASLTRLSLTLNTISIPNLDLSEITFPNLQKFDLCIDPNGCMGLPRRKKLKPSIHVDLIPFAQRHRETITALSMNFRLGATDLGYALLSNMPVFPSLRSLSIKMWIRRSTSTSGLYSILRSHSDHIERLDLQLAALNETCEYPMSHSHINCECTAWWQSQPFLNITFPRLEYLKCSLERTGTYDLLLWYLARVAKPVKVLDLRFWAGVHYVRRFGYEEIDALTRIFDKCGGSSRLEKLYIECGTLAPEMLWLLAARLRQLKFLHLSFDRMGPLGVETDSRHLEMCRRDYCLQVYRSLAGEPCSEWELETVVLDDQVYSCPSHNPALCKVAMAMALPNVKSLEYNDREWFP